VAVFVREKMEVEIRTPATMFTFVTQIVKTQTMKMKYPTLHLVFTPNQQPLVDGKTTSILIRSTPPNFTITQSVVDSSKRKFARFLPLNRRIIQLIPEGVDEFQGVDVYQRGMFLNYRIYTAKFGLIIVLACMQMLKTILVFM
jgi:hypothetical protein